MHALFFAYRSIIWMFVCKCVFVHAVVKEDSVPVCFCCGCLCGRPWIWVVSSCVRVWVRVLLCVFVSVRALLSARLVFSLGGNSGGSSLQRERDRGRLEFSGVCLRLGPLLNEEFSILLIMLLWLMSLSADSGECNKTLLLFGLFAFFNWAE